MRITATASFYDGTPVPDLALRFTFEDGNQRVEVTTDSLGVARAVLKVASPDYQEAWFTPYVQVVPVHPEEGQINGDRSVVAFPSRAWLRAEGSVTGNKIVVTGTLTWADLAGFEAALASGKGDYELDDASGAPIPGGSIRASVTHLIPVRRQTGTDLRLHREEGRADVRVRHQRGLDGLVHPDRCGGRDVPALDGRAGPGRWLSDHLEHGRPGRPRVPGRGVCIGDHSTTKSTSRNRSWPQAMRPRPEPNGCGFAVTVRAALEAPVSLTMYEGNGDVAADGRYLFLVGRRGSVETTILDASTFIRVMRDADIPDFTVRVIRLAGDGYVVADAEVFLDLAGKTITVGLRPDKASYRPGEPVRIDVTTTDSSGRPISADVVVQGVDEKLFTLGLAGGHEPARDADGVDLVRLPPVLSLAWPPARRLRWLRGRGWRRRAR